MTWDLLKPLHFHFSPYAQVLGRVYTEHGTFLHIQITYNVTNQQAFEPFCVNTALDDSCQNRCRKPKLTVDVDNFALPPVAVNSAQIWTFNLHPSCKNSSKDSIKFLPPLAWFPIISHAETHPHWQERRCNGVKLSSGQIQCAFFRSN